MDDLTPQQLRDVVKWERDSLLEEGVDLNEVELCSHEANRKAWNFLFGENGIIERS